jgi:hypothetical protein
MQSGSPGWLQVRFRFVFGALVQGIMAARLGEGDVGRCGCAAVGCGARLPPAAARQLLPKGQLPRYEQLLAQGYADANPAIRWCALLSAARPML